MRPVTQKQVSLRIALAVAASASGLSALAAGVPEKRRLDDLLVGADGATVRVAALCRPRCEITASDDPETIGSFRIEGVEKSLDIDLAGRAGVADRLRLTPAAGGSLLTVSAAAVLNSARVIDCRTEAGPARCVEFRFDSAAPAVADAPAAWRPASLRGEEAPAEPAPAPKRAATPAAKASEKTQPAPAIRSDATAPGELPFLGSAVIEANPRLRESPDERLSIPDFAAPERLAPPPRAGSREIVTTLRERVDAPAQDSFDLTREMAAILDKKNDPATCVGAAARLGADAWALDAMVDLAFCKAASGALDDADADFVRLLAYTPDDHRALVGRGLIALAKGDRQRGIELMQAALNALPPIHESDRIAAAMARY